MSRRRKRIAAATLLMVSVLGLGLAGYIGATNASGKETFTTERYPSGFHRYRLNHQIGTGTSAYAWSDSSEADAGRNVYAGSAAPEDATTEKQSDAETAGTSDAIGAGGNKFDRAPAAPAPGASGSGGEENWTPSSFRLAGSYGPGYRGTGGGGGSQGAVNQPNNEEPTSTQPTDETPTTKPEDEPKTDPTDPVDPVDPKGPTNPNGPGTPDYPPGDHPPGDKPVSVPEPATLGLLGFGLAALGYMRRRRATAA